MAHFIGRDLASREFVFGFQWGSNLQEGILEHRIPVENHRSSDEQKTERKNGISVLRNQVNRPTHVDIRRDFNQHHLALLGFVGPNIDFEALQKHEHGQPQKPSR